VVQHLILLGTPSAGSPWPQTVAGLTTLLTMALNGLSGLTALSMGPLPVSLVLKMTASIVQRIETIDVTLDEMEPDSDFIQELATSDDPGIPYTVLAGNIGLINPAASPQKKLAAKLMARLKELMKLPFFGVPNDLAVTVDSIKAIPAGRTPTPVVMEVACDHLVYFTDPAGVTSLGNAVQDILTGREATRPPAPPDEPAPPPPPAPPQPEPQPETASEPQPESNHAESAEPAGNGFPIGWVVGAIALILAIALGVKLLNQPQPEPEPNPSSQSLSRVETS
jgi:hypothetical protein